MWGQQPLRGAHPCRGCYSFRARGKGDIEAGKAVRGERPLRAGVILFREREVEADRDKGSPGRGNSLRRGVPSRWLQTERGEEMVRYGDVQGFRN